MKTLTSRKVAFAGMLGALALALSWAESMLAPLLGLPPGVKIGLANIVVLYALLFTSRKLALSLVLFKAGFAFITRGATAGALSAAGGLLSFLVMVVLLLPKWRVSVLLLSVAGALAHNIGQLLVVWMLFGSVAFFYAPILILAGIGMGVLTAVLLRVLLPALQKAGIPNTKEVRRGD